MAPSDTQVATPSNTNGGVPPSPPSQSEAAVPATASPPPTVLMTEKKFSFRTVTSTNALGEELKEKRPTVTLELPLPTWTGFAAVASDPKVQEYTLSLFADAITEAARLQVSSEEKPVNKQSELDLGKLTLLYLANEPKVDQRGRAIDKETWEAFAKDYIAVMPAIIDKSIQQVTFAAELFTKKFAPIKTKKDVIGKLADYLDRWFEHSPNNSEFGEVYKYLSEKADSLLKADMVDYEEAL